MRTPRRHHATTTALLLALVVALTACGDRVPVEDPGEPTTTSTEAPPTPQADPGQSDPGQSDPGQRNDGATALLAAACEGGVGVSVAGTAPEELSSISGLAASRRHPGVVWAIEDSFEPADLVALDRTATTRGRVRVEAGALANLDWEDLAVATDEAGTSRVHVADIGDNLGIRREVRVLSFDEPDLDTTEVVADELRLTYESGRPNAEALAVIGESVWVIDKAPGAASTIWRAERDPSDPGRGVLRPVGTVDVGGEAVTGIDVSPDATVLGLRTLDAVRLYPLGPDGDVAAALAGPGCATPPPPERQGESIAFSGDGSAVFTVSEDESGGAVELHRLDARTATG